MYKSLNEREKFNKGMDSELLSNGFNYYSDWRYGPQICWSGHDISSIKLMRHDYGYWIIIRLCDGVAHTEMNIGSSNDAKEIIAVRDALQKLW